MAVQANQNNSNTLAYILLLLVIVGLSAFAYYKLEYRIEEVDQGFQGEALTNPYLAAEYFLRNMGQKSEKIKLFVDTQKQLENNDTLLVPSSRIAFDNRRSTQLLEWVEAGGHLIITGKPYLEDESNIRDHILDKLGLYIERRALKEGQDQDEQPVNLDIEDDDDFWQVDFDDYLVVSFAEKFDQDIIWTIVDNDRIHAVQLRLGDGRLTLMSDIRMFRNDYIESYDHAAFLYELTKDQLSSAEAGTFYYSLYEDYISLIKWLWDNAQPLIISILFIIIIVLWMLIPRFGPLINIHQPIRRRFLEHLSASGNYHWRQGHYARLLTEVRKQLSLQTKLKYPEWTNLSKQDQVNHFAELSQIEAPAIEKALFDSNIERINDFVNKIKILEKLRKSL